MADDRDPIDVVAPFVLRRLLRDADAGRVVFTHMEIGDDASCALALTWRIAAPPVPASATPTAGSPPAPATPTDRCPACGAGPLVEHSDGRTCPSCLRDFA